MREEAKNPVDLLGQLEGLRIGLDQADVVPAGDVDLAPDGTPWAIFYSDCTDSDAFCRKAVTEPVPEGHILSGPQATTIGRLAWPLPEPDLLASLVSGAAFVRGACPPSRSSVGAGATARSRSA